MRVVPEMRLSRRLCPLLFFLAAFAHSCIAERTVLALYDTSYVQLHTGDPARTNIYQLRFDLSLPSILSQSAHDSDSRTLDTRARTEQLQFGPHVHRLSYVGGVYVAPRAASLQSRSDLVAPDGVIPMGALSPLWMRHHQWQIDSEHLVLGAYRPLHRHRFELSVHGRVFCALVGGAAYAVRVDLANDYTLVPLSLYWPHNASSSDLVLRFQRWGDDSGLDSAGSERIRITLNARSSLLRLDTLANTSTTLTPQCAAADAASLPLITLGRLHTLEHFAYGRDEARDRTSLVWRLAVHTQSSSLVHYLWLAVVLVALLVVWYAGVYESALQRHYREAVESSAATSDANAFVTVANALFVRSIVYYSQLVCAVVSLVLLLGLRVDMLAEPDIASPVYARLVCYVALASVLVRSMVSERQMRVLGLAACTSIGNALLHALWLTASVESAQLANLVVMTVAATMVLLRDCESALLVLYPRLHPQDALMAPLRAREPLWLVCAALRCASSAFLFAGYTLPSFIFFWWPGQPFAPALIAACVVAVVCWAMLNVSNGTLMLAHQKSLKASSMLDEPRDALAHQRRVQSVPLIL